MIELYKYKDKIIRVIGKTPRLILSTNFIARTQPGWFVAFQNRFEVERVRNNYCNNVTYIYFTLHNSEVSDFDETMQNLIDEHLN